MYLELKVASTSTSTKYYISAVWIKVALSFFLNCSDLFRVCNRICEFL